MKDQQAPLITVYITNYNYAPYIKTCVSSVLNQTLQDFELLIIDDGSTDNSREIIEEYRNHPNVSIIYQQNRGLNITNNVAIRASAGTYIMRLDADDFLDPEALHIMSAVLEADSSLGLVFPDYYYVDKEGNTTGEERRHDFDKEVSLYDQPAHGACTMIRLEFLKRVGGYNENFNCQDGYDLWLKFITHYKVTNINRPLFFYRRHGHNLTANEHRVLSTRRQIKEAFVTDNFVPPEVLAIIPAKNTYIGKVNWPLMQLGGKTVIEGRVEVCLKAKNISHVVITSADSEILEYCAARFATEERVSIAEQSQQFQSLPRSLTQTIAQAVASVSSGHGDFDAIMSLSLEYPFLDPDVPDEMIHTLLLFKCDSVLSVRPDKGMYYQHTGHTWKPILDQERFTQVEREAVYKGAGGVVLSTRENFEKNKTLVSGRVSHVVVDSRSAFGVFNDFDLQVAEALMRST